MVSSEPSGPKDPFFLGLVFVSNFRRLASFLTPSSEPRLVDPDDEAIALLFEANDSGIFRGVGSSGRGRRR